ncbi:MAG: hypothetical protein COX79_00830 [Candidatus Levybacteria bacterium CG_4_10_14_0_2_um_filter_36_16]|nr:MAG: hypothetical protein AUK12_01470 [Candidatus Levybacteria bacterium CG2_30_37_29]PIR79427.1 MAG: hypothetical protein COU26_01265 [Candidatus Levybacteria bacterium CG10_big_fil_rev_8_21_14_0_10_36_30]PIZ97828.1 MAG: hypothetical protein COX79_00830 [Candidatus Levybacteria bacterium CG_4_10_14_0_2_um_filter_36_16]PJA90508.1 MAG: hypothetical protein CO136_01975 [Candidatus Levybacteria bacterium CG_4_9_14_3_um_filter_36_7]
MSIEALIPVSAEVVSQPVSKAVIIMYPDGRITGGRNDIPKTSLVEDFYSVVSKQIARYKKKGFTIFGIVYQDTTQENFSVLYPVHEFDRLVEVPRKIDEWKHEEHEDLLDEVIGKLNLSETAETIVGGYHALDCVVEMAKVLRRNNFNVQVNPLLTNELAFLLISHLARVNYILKERKLDLDIWKMKKEDLQNAINK